MVLKEKLIVHTKHRLYLITQGNIGYIDFCIQMIIIRRKLALLNIMGSYAEYNLLFFYCHFFQLIFTDSLLTCAVQSYLGELSDRSDSNVF